MKKSRGHITFRKGWEYFSFKHYIYKAKTDRDIGSDGYRVGARWRAGFVLTTQVTGRHTTYDQTNMVEN